MTAKDNYKSRSADAASTSIAIPRLAFPSASDDFMGPFNDRIAPIFPDSLKSFWSELQDREPTVDFQDRGSHYLLTAELPGFDRKDIEVRVDSNVLEMKAERRSGKESKAKEGSLVQRGHSYFHRFMTLPEEVVSEKASGTMKNGVLELKLPKKATKIADKPRRVDLK